MFDFFSRIFPFQMTELRACDLDKINKLIKPKNDIAQEQC